MTKPKLRIGLIGSGFMGRAHAFGYSIAARVFDLPFEVELHMIADIGDEAAAKAALALGFARATSDWRSLVADPAIDVVNITTPNALQGHGPGRDCHRQTCLLRKATGAICEGLPRNGRGGRSSWSKDAG